MESFADLVTNTLTKAVLTAFSVLGSAISFEDPKGDIDLWKVIPRQRKPLKEELVEISYREKVVKKISLYLVSPYLGPYWAWFPDGGAPAMPFQPFSWVLLCGGKSRGRPEGTLVRRLRNRCSEAEVAFHYLAISAALLDLRPAPMEVKSVGSRIQDGELDEAAKSLFRVFGDLLPRAIWILQTLQFPDGKSVETLYDEIGVEPLRRWPPRLIEYRVFPVDAQEMTGIVQEGRWAFEQAIEALEGQGVNLDLCQRICNRVYEKMVEVSLG
jgi:hypothetical protein